MEDYQENPVKQFLTPYELFTEHKIPQLRTAHPQKSNVEIGMKCAQEWALLSFEQKQNYKKMAQDDRQRFEKSYKEGP